MKSSTAAFRCLSLVLVIVLSGFASAQRSPPSEWKWIDKNIAEGCEHATLFSPTMNREVGYSLYLPPSYVDSPDRRYPVVYYLHGAGGSESSSREFAWAVRQAIAEEKIEDMICVFPNGGHYSAYRDWKDDNVKAETWVIGELIPHIDKTLRTIARREGRALCGWSMGGGGSLRFLTKYPDMFCGAATLSAAVGYEADGRKDTAENHLMANAEKLRGRTGIWMAVGADDFLRSNNEDFVASLKKSKLEHSFQIAKDVDHNLGKMMGLFHDEVVMALAENLDAVAPDESDASEDESGRNKFDVGKF